MSRVGIKTVGRVAALVVLLVAIMGPWMFDRLSVPGQYACSDPNVRLDDDFCGSPVSLISWLGAAFGPRGMVVELLSGSGGEYEPRDIVGSCLFVCFLLLPALPFLSTLPLLLRGERRGLWVFHLTAWGLAAAISVFWLAADWHGAVSLRLWGAWLCAGVAVAMLAAEIWAARIRSGQGAGSTEALAG